MATYTSRLGLKRPDVTDPFLTQDFYDNYNALDAAPGLHICTSSTKPNWGPAQAGRGIWMTDQKYSQHWSGTNWIEPVGSAGGTFFSLIADAEISRNTTVTYSLGSFNISRPARLHIVLNAQMAILGNRRQWMTAKPVINGVDAEMGHDNQWRHTGASELGGYWYYMPLTALGNVNLAPAGTVNVGVKIIVGSDTDPVRYRGSKVLILLGRENAAN